MTRVDFYHDAADARDVAARLAQKGVAAGLRITIVVPDEEAASQIDQTLWSFSPSAFVPHALADSPLAAQSPVVIHLQKKIGNATSLTPHMDEDPAAAFQLLINLSDSVVEDAERYERVIEIVTHDEANKAAARDRFKAYRAQGFDLNAHRLGKNND